MTKECELLERAEECLRHAEYPNDYREQEADDLREEIRTYLSTHSADETHLKVNDMRKLNIGTEKYTQVFATDTPDFGANHTYLVQSVGEGKFPLTTVHFQKGLIREVGVNGCMNEDLIAIVIDRLEGFQTTSFKCRENALAITKLEEALLWLRKRTMEREARGVEGTHEV